MSGGRRTSGTGGDGRIALRRAYDPPSADDGYRILVDRVWPRGVRREEASIDEWARGVAPSDELRRWFGHDPRRWDEFRRRYLAELEAPDRRPVVEAIARRAADGPVSLVFGARDREHNQAVVLAGAVEAALARGERPHDGGRSSPAESELRR